MENAITEYQEGGKSGPFSHEPKLGQQRSCELSELDHRIVAPLTLAGQCESLGFVAAYVRHIRGLCSQRALPRSVTRSN
jgi:hypothetical protein